MRQTASKSIRTTIDGRPYMKELGEIFASLVISLPMTAHRVRFTKVEETFTSEEAVQYLGSLKSSQSHKMPDPKDPSRLVTTTAITTFSMTRDMARLTCQCFLDARFIESADGKMLSDFAIKGGTWQLTHKGICVLHRWCSRIGARHQHIEPLLKRDQLHMVSLERDETTDQLSQDKSTVEVIFRRFAGQDGPNVKPSTQSSDSDSVHDYQTGLLGVKMARERKIFDKSVPLTFTGKAASDWLIDCCSTKDRRETHELMELFIKHKLVWPLVEDRMYAHQYSSGGKFQPTKNAIYTFLERGRSLCSWQGTESAAGILEKISANKDAWGQKDSHTTRLNVIVRDPALRLLFREFLNHSL